MTSERTIFSPEQLRSLTKLRDHKSWLELCKFDILGFPFRFWEVVFRRNRQWISHKAAAMFIPQHLAERITMRGQLESQAFFQQLKSVEQDAKLLMLRALRPYTYFPWEDDGGPTGLRANWQLELPGGQVKGTSGADVAIKELTEEAGIGAEQVLCWAPAFFSPTANDGGTHVERYGLWYVLCTGEAHAPMDKKDPARLREGIVGYNVHPITSLQSFIHLSALEGVPIEVWVHTAVFGIVAGLYV